MAAPEIRIERATPDHAARLAPRMRATDVAEVAAAGGYTPLEAVALGVDLSAVALSLFIGDDLAAMWGVAPIDGSDAGAIWMLTTDAVDRHPLTFLRLCRGQVAVLLEAFPVLVNAIDARYKQALRWAKWMGFTVSDPEPFGVAGLPFHRIDLRRPASV